MAEVCFLSAAELARRIAAGEISSLELTEAYLARIEQYDPLLRAFITVDAEGALAAARAADNVPTNQRTGPLQGVPVAIKDNIATRGLRTTAGSRVLADWVPDRDAPVVRRLCKAGAIILGKANLHEFAYGGTCTNVEFGAVRNPWNTEHVPGGSSGGSAVAVAAGLCAAALGTDTAGSVRLPASQCGIVGLKPTYGRSSIQDVLPLAWSLDHVGPLTRTVEDAALLLELLAETPVERATESGIAGWRLGVPRGYFFDGVRPDILDAVERALQVLRDLGATVIDVEWPSVHLSNSATWTIILAEASAFHRTWFEAHPERYSDETRTNLELGGLLPAADYVQAQRVRAVLQQQTSDLFEQVDALVSPMLAISPPRIGQSTVEVGGKVKEINPVFIRLADPFNLTGQPAISVPCGFDSVGLPIGLQIAAAAGAEHMVLRVASAFEAATNWHQRRPPLDDARR
ncbi:MAG TPA: amidase [Chloroflexota bacterium]|jgi:aspartyl-tRNA(Asn)/glutamyl-tRNA(Gln) amidotransferase subunit A|nr:amidase [Chloroflexota bacterium]